MHGCAGWPDFICANKTRVNILAIIKEFGKITSLTRKITIANCCLKSG
jgi:hypothetical protein